MDKWRTKCFRESILSYFIGYSSISQSLCKLNCMECECVLGAVVVIYAKKLVRAG